MKGHPNYHNSDIHMDEKGFTLIELIIAIVIFSIGILGIGAMHYESIRGNNFAMQVTRANNLSEDYTEYFKALPYASDSMGGTAPLAAEVGKVLNIPDSDDNTGHIPYKIRWYINQARDHNNNVMNDMRIVTVETWWDNDSHHVSFNFYKKL